MGKHEKQLHEKRIEIRWRDQDPLGHVNNAVYATYFEEARDEWVDTLLHGVSSVTEFALAHVSIDFRRELTQDDGYVISRCRIVRIGNSSIRTREELAKLDGTIAAQAEAVLVARDPGGGSRPLTHRERAALEPHVTSPCPEQT